MSGETTNLLYFLFSLSSLLAVRGEVINGGFGLLLDGSEVPRLCAV